MNCPKCGLEMLDQRASKQNPKQPDFICQDSTCLNDKGYRSGVWLQKQASPPKQVRVNGGGPKWTWSQLSTLYQRSLLVAGKHVTAVCAVAKVTPTAADIIAAGATIFIAASRDGVQDTAEKAPPTPLTEKPAALVKAEADDDLPF